MGKRNIRPAAKPQGHTWLASATCVVLMMLLSAVTRPAGAVETLLGVAYEMGYSSNISRQAVEGPDEWIDTTTMSGTLRQAGSRVDADIDFGLRYLHYRKGVYDDDLLGTFAGKATVKLMPERLSWTVQDYYDQQPINSLGAATPDNQQNVNVLWTGPDLSLRFGPAFPGALQLRYGSLKYSASDADSDRLSADARLDYKASPSTTYSASVQHLVVSFADDSINENFQRSDAFVSWGRKQAVWDVRAAVGGIHIARERSSALDGLLLSGAVTRHLTPAFAVSLRITNGYSEAGRDLLAAGEAGSAVARTDFVEDTSLFYRRELELAVAQHGMRGAFDVKVYGRDADYEVSDFDSRELGAEAQWQYQLGALNSIGLFATLSDTDFTILDRRDRDSAYGVRWAYRLSRSLSFGFEAGHYGRASNIDAGEFDENRVLLSVGYARRTLHPVIN